MKKGSLLAGLGSAFMGTMVLLNNLGKPRIEGRVGHGELLVIDVRHGLPFSVEIEWLGNR